MLRIFANELPDPIVQRLDQRAAPDGAQGQTPGPTAATTAATAAPFQAELTITGHSHHYLGHVMRGRPGQDIEVLTGRAWILMGTITGFERDRTFIRIDRVRLSAPPSGPPIVLVCALLKQPAMETVLQKVSELGIDALVTVASERSVPKRTAKAQDRSARWQTITQQACCQSGRAIPPLLPPVQANLEDGLAQADRLVAELAGQRKARLDSQRTAQLDSQRTAQLDSQRTAQLDSQRKTNQHIAPQPTLEQSKTRYDTTTCRGILHPGLPDDSRPDHDHNQPPHERQTPTLSLPAWLHDGCSQENTPAGYLAAIGPEGGWTDDEVQAARAAGFRAVTMGPLVLRAETAVLAVASLLAAAAGRMA